MDQPILETSLPKLGKVKRGKVRDIYDLGKYLLIIATDRTSAFDVVLPNGILRKGKVLTKMSKMWFSLTEGVVANHLISVHPESFPRSAGRICPFSRAGACS